MNNFGFNSLSSENSLSQLLRQYMPAQQPENIQPQPEPQQSGYSGTKVYEIMKNDDLKYIKPDNTGQKQIIWCEPEKTMYIARYNYATEKPDYEKYISEGTIELFKKNDSSADMSQVAEALLAVANKFDAVADKLDSMDSKIQGLQNREPAAKPAKEESGRNDKGQFKKKGEK